MKLFSILGFALGVTFFSIAAAAHPLDVGLLEAKVSGNQIAFRFQFDPKAATEITGVRGEYLQDAKIGGEKDILFAATLGAVPVVLVSGQECAWQAPLASLRDQKVTLEVNSVCPSDVEAWSLKLPFFSRAPNTFEVVAKIQTATKQFQLVANAKQPSLDIVIETEHSFGQFVSMGIHHIGAVPSEWMDQSGFHFPEGIDHILFVFALVLAGGGFIGILKTVTGFTIGHSLTLAMATLNWIHVPSRFVESAIALSISIVAAESIFSKNSKNRWKIAMAFGLIHGLGFASALSDLKLSAGSLVHALIGFNVGVELGQAVIVAILLPFIVLLGKNAWSKKFVLPALAGIIFCIGGFWFVQRAFGL